MKRIGIVGSRRRNSQEDLEKVLLHFLSVYEKGSSMIVSGGCSRGGDKFAEIIASRFDIRIRIYKADWRRYGKGAGFIRNTDIAENSDILIACVTSDRKGGTEDTIKKFLKTHPESSLILC